MPPLLKVLAASAEFLHRRSMQPRHWGREIIMLILNGNEAKFVLASYRFDSHAPVGATLRDGHGNRMAASNDRRGPGQVRCRLRIIGQLRDPQFDGRLGNKSLHRLGSATEHGCLDETAYYIKNFGERRYDCKICSKLLEVLRRVVSGFGHEPDVSQTRSETLG